MTGYGKQSIRRTSKKIMSVFVATVMIVSLAPLSSSASIDTSSSNGSSTLPGYATSDSSIRTASQQDAVPGDYATTVTATQNGVSLAASATWDDESHANGNYKATETLAVSGATGAVTLSTVVPGDWVIDSASYAVDWVSLQSDGIYAIANEGASGALARVTWTISAADFNNGAATKTLHMTLADPSTYSDGTHIPTSVDATSTVTSGTQKATLITGSTRLATSVGTLFATSPSLGFQKALANAEPATIEALAAPILSASPIVITPQAAYPDHIVNGSFEYPGNSLLRFHQNAGGNNSVVPYSFYFCDVMAASGQVGNQPAGVRTSYPGMSVSNFGWTSTQTSGYAGEVEYRAESGPTNLNNHYVELCADQAGTAIYQDISTTPGAVYKWYLKHSSINKYQTNGVYLNGYLDKMSVLIGTQSNQIAQTATRLTSNGASMSSIFRNSPQTGDSNQVGYTSTIIETPAKKTSSDLDVYGNDFSASFEQYSGTYLVPSGQTVTRFTFRSVDSPSPIYGNEMDDIYFSIAYPLWYDANGGTGAPSTEVNTVTGVYYNYFNAGEVPTLSTVKPSRPGYTFAGWSRQTPSASNNYLVYASQSAAQANAGIVTSYNSIAPSGTSNRVYAVWVGNEISVSSTSINFLTKKMSNDSGTLDSSKTFSFNLAASTATYEDGTTGTSPLPSRGTTGTATFAAGSTAGSTASVNFGDFTFNRAGTYTYRVTETTPSDAVWTCDNTQKTVIVTIGPNSSNTALEVKSVTGTSATNASYQEIIKSGSSLATWGVPAGVSTAHTMASNSGTFTVSPASLPAGAVMTGTEVHFYQKLSGASTANPAADENNDASSQSVLYWSKNANGSVQFTPGSIYGLLTDGDYGPLLSQYYYYVKINYQVPAGPVVIENKYLSTGKLDTATNALLSKKIDGNFSSAPKRFNFTISAVTSGAPMPSPATGYVDFAARESGTKTVSFGTITYNHVGDYTYTVQETTASGSGWTCDTAPKTVTVHVADNGDGTLTPSVTSSATITNSYSATGVLNTSTTALLNKVVSENSSSASETFNFTLRAVSLRAPMPSSNTGSVTYAAGETGTKPVSFGSITYSVPGNYTYSVQESAGTSGWSGDTGLKEVTVQVVDNGNGTLTATVPTPASVINSYAASGPLDTSTTPVLTKTVDVNKSTVPKGFDFRIEAVTSGAPVPSPTTGHVDYAAGETGTKTVSFGSITYTAIGDYTYRVYETTASGSGWICDTTAHEVTVHVADNGDGTLTATVPTPVSVTNSCYESPVADLTVAKTVTGDYAPADKTFTMTVTLTNASGTAITGTYSVTNPDGTSSNVTLGSGGTITFNNIKGGQQFVIHGLPSDARYTVVENPAGTYWSTAWSGLRAGYVIPMSTYAPANDPSSTSNRWIRYLTDYVPAGTSWGVTKTIKDLPRVTSLASAGYSVVLKTVVYGNLINPAVDENANASLVEQVGTPSVGAEGIDFTAGSVYGFATNDDEYKNVIAYWYVYAESAIANEGATNTATGIVAAMPKVTFTNTYTAPVGTLDTSTIPVFKKNVSANLSNTSKTFDFELTAVTAGAPLPASAVDSVAMGSVSYAAGETGEKTVPFGMITYHAQGDYSYKIKETTQSGSGWICDNGEKTVTVHVADNGDGTLTASVVAPASVTNFCAESPITDLKIGKTVVGNAPADKTFTMTVTLKDVSGNPLTGTYQVTNPDGTSGDVAFDGLGMAVFSGIQGGQSLTIKGLPSNATYTVSETDPGDYWTTAWKGVRAGYEIPSNTLTPPLSAASTAKRWYKTLLDYVPATAASGTTATIADLPQVAALASHGYTAVLKQSGDTSSNPAIDSTTAQPDLVTPSVGASGINYTIGDAYHLLNDPSYPEWDEVAGAFYIYAESAITNEGTGLSATGTVAAMPAVNFTNTYTPPVVAVNLKKAGADQVAGGYKLLQGATFNLYKYVGTDALTAANINSVIAPTSDTSRTTWQPIVNVDGTVSSTGSAIDYISDEDGVLTSAGSLPKLEAGSYYMLVETAAPAGYYCPKGSWAIKANEFNVVDTAAILSRTGTDGNMPPAMSTSVSIRGESFSGLFVIDQPIFTLPHSGGSMLWLVVLVGLGMLVLAWVIGGSRIGRRKFGKGN